MRLGELLKRLIQVDPDDESDAVPQNIASEEIVEALGESTNSLELQLPQTAKEREPSVSEAAAEELPTTQSDIKQSPESTAMFATAAELEEAGINPADLFGDDVEESQESDYSPEPENEPVEESEPVVAEVATEIESSEESQEPDDQEPEIESVPKFESIEDTDTDTDTDTDFVEPMVLDGFISEDVLADHESAEIVGEIKLDTNDLLPEPTGDEQDERSLAHSAVNAGFVITLATELRTPISSLRVSFDLLKDPEAIRNNPDETKRLVGNIERSIARLERQASDLLEVGYINTGSLSLIKQPINMSEPILAAMDVSRSTAALRQVAIELDIEPNLPRPIADGFRLTQIMTHLLSNSIKFTPVGKSTTISITSGNVDSLGPSGEIQSGSPDAEPDSIIVRVIDNGPGIREAHFERVFEPFYRITGEGIEGGAGVGLGLTIVKGLVELHSGTVWVRSIPREVTEFGFSIPLK